MPQGGDEGAREALEAFWRQVSEAAALQPVPAQPARHAARPLDARPLARLRRLRPDVAAVLALRPQSRRQPIRCATILAESDRFRAPGRARRSSCSSPRPTCAPARRACSATPRSRPTCCWPRPACRRCSRRSRSTARPIGTAAIPAIRPSRRWCANASRDDTILVADQSGRAARHAAIGARHPQPPERGVVQRRAAEGTAHDGAAAPGRRSGDGEGARWAQHAHPPDHAATCMDELGYSSKLNAEWEFLSMLRDEGRRAAEAFLATHGDDLGKRSTARSRPPAGGVSEHGPCSASCSASAC